MSEPKKAADRTLGLMLQAIGMAVGNSGKEVEFYDHAPHYLSVVEKHAAIILGIAAALELKVVVRTYRTRIWVQVK